MWSVLASVCVLVAAAPSKADSWKFSATPYVWLPNVNALLPTIMNAGIPG